MAFNSYIFVLLFFPICISVYFLLCKYNKYQLSNIFLIIASFAFYAYSNIKYLYILIVSLIVNYSVCLLINKHSKKIVLVFGVAFNVFLLLYFKYFNFFVESINEIFKLSISFNKTILPLAISFYTFTQISFIVDAYRGEIKECKLIDYLLYVTYFPKMIQGPIMYFSEMAPQFNDVNRKMINWENMVEGFERFVFGLSKKVLLADVLARAVGSGFLNIESLDLINGLIVMLSYTLQIYLDFSGYSDMAIGISKMFNIDLIENFNNPYKAINISDFWKRWHISLTRFLTKYIYIPLGGNRKGETRTYINTIIVFLISGLWHGANWTFILWGLTNGIAMVIYKKYSKYFNRIPKFISWLIAFVFISFAWIIFRASSINEFILFIEKIFNFKSLKLNQELIDSFAFTSFDFVPETLQFIRMFKTSRFYVLIYLFIGMYAALKQYSINGGRNSKLVRVLIILLFVYSVISFTGTNAFVYEGF